MTFQFYGYWGGPGWSDGHFTVPGEEINWLGKTKDIVDDYAPMLGRLRRRWWLMCSSRFRFGSKKTFW